MKNPKKPKEIQESEKSQTPVYQQQNEELDPLDFMGPPTVFQPGEATTERYLRAQRKIWAAVFKKNKK